MFLKPSAGRGWAPHSVGVSGTVTQRWVLVLGFPWLTHPAGCASAGAGVVCEGVWVETATHTEGSENWEGG